NDPLAISGPLKIIDPTRENTKFVLENIIIVSSPNADGAGDIGRCNPFAVRGVTGDGDGIRMFAVNGNL
ncbi:hypothetical protein A2U01_0038741, partial [Trifolium medium]|nr:hypothetical protein [Trifolium medium]